MSYGELLRLTFLRSRATNLSPERLKRMARMKVPTAATTKTASKINTCWFMASGTHTHTGVIINSCGFLKILRVHKVFALAYTKCNFV